VFFGIWPTRRDNLLFITGLKLAEDMSGILYANTPIHSQSMPTLISRPKMKNSAKIRRDFILDFLLHLIAVIIVSSKFR
jgi:hypothetical protein